LLKLPINTNAIIIQNFQPAVSTPPLVLHQSYFPMNSGPTPKTYTTELEGKSYTLPHKSNSNKACFALLFSYV